MTLQKMIKKAFETNKFKVKITNHDYKYALTSVWGKIKIIENNVKCQMLVSNDNLKAGAFRCKIGKRTVILRYNDERIEGFI